MVSFVHCAASAAPREKSSSESTSTTARSWLPARMIAHSASASATHASGSAPYPTRSPRHHSSSTCASLAASITASKAWRLPWMSDAIATRMPRVCSVLRSWRLPVALVTAVVVAEAAVLVMRPRGLPDPVPVLARDYFSAAQIDRAEAFRDGQLWLYVAQTALGLAVLALIVRRPPRRLEAIGRPILAGAAVAAAISVTTAVAALPLAAVARDRAKDVGLVTQAWPDWLADRAKATGDRHGLRRPRRRRARVRHAPFRPALVDPRRGGRRRLRRDHHLRGPDRPRPGVQQVHAGAGGRAAQRRAGARGRGRRRRRPGVRDGRLAPHDRRQRVCDRARAHEARRALRHARRRLHARRDADGRGARARSRQPSRHPQRADLARDRGAVRDVGGRGARRAARAARRRARARARCPPRRWPSRSSCRS